ncbi:hypothetical protein [Acetobacter musti]|uniref:hypothetical protein n=1 Tax=Acetobacter musti TaxID=864732 RepID=UPI00156B58B0|nr:hypothetical protein [Acetobacter musti]
MDARLLPTRLPGGQHQTLTRADHGGDSQNTVALLQFRNAVRPDRPRTELQARQDI